MTTLRPALFTPRRIAWGVAAAVLLLALAAAWVVWRNLRGEHDDGGPRSTLSGAALIERGAYLARAGNCLACHTARGGVPGAGGRPFETPFGTVYASNLTPDADTGLGGWSADDFWRALHNGRSRDGRLLYSAFPYPQTTLVSRADADALYAWLMAQPPVRQPVPPHELRWPYSTQSALAVWRALFFEPGVYRPDPQRDAEWNRGAYLVRGLGHCAACHAPRNALGATRRELDLAGGLIPLQNWYAPSLSRRDEASVADWPRADVVALLRDGVSARGFVSGPMAEVVLTSTQYLNASDLNAMAAYLQALPASGPAPAVAAAAGVASPGGASGTASGTASAHASGARVTRGAQLYEQHCAQCHGERGEGRPLAVPALAGNRAVTMDNTVNLVQIVLAGGFSPATQGNPRPHGMPPFVLRLSEGDIAELLTHLRSAWGHQAAPVSALDVVQQRAGFER